MVFITNFQGFTRIYIFEGENIQNLVPGLLQLIMVLKLKISLIIRELSGIIHWRLCIKSYKFDLLQKSALVIFYEGGNFRLVAKTIQKTNEGKWKRGVFYWNPPGGGFLGPKWAMLAEIPAQKIGKNRRSFAGNERTTIFDIFFFQWKFAYGRVGFGEERAVSGLYMVKNLVKRWSKLLVRVLWKIG